VVGRKLAARVLKAWTEDFVDEDTGEVVSIERHEVIIDRETVIEPEHVDMIIESGVQNILVHNQEANTSDYSIIFNTLQKDPSNSEKEAVLYIYRQLRNADPADDASAREVINNLYNARETLYEYSILIDAEINRKRSEFGLPLLEDEE
jgi:DNA-directed RNA polymerase subunit beta